MIPIEHASTSIAIPIALFIDKNILKFNTFEAIIYLSFVKLNIFHIN